MRYFAELDDQYDVKRVIVCESEQLCVRLLGGLWVETDINGDNYAGPRFRYNLGVGTFTPSQPRDSAGRPDPRWRLSPDKKRWVKQP